MNFPFGCFQLLGSTIPGSRGKVSRERTQTWPTEPSLIETRLDEPSNSESSLDFGGNSRLDQVELKDRLERSSRVKGQVPRLDSARLDKLDSMLI